MFTPRVKKQNLSTRQLLFCFSIGSVVRREIIGNFVALRSISGTDLFERESTFFLTIETVGKDVECKIKQKYDQFNFKYIF